MSLRTRLLLSLTLLALVPLILFGLTANAAATSSLINVERDNLEEALTSVKGGLVYIQANGVKTLKDYSDWDDMHTAVDKSPADQDFLKTTFDPGSSGSTTNSFNLALVGVWDKDNQSLYSLGPVDEFVKQTGAKVKIVLDNSEQAPTLLAIGSDIYMIAYRPIRTTAGKDSNGMLAFGRKLGADDIDQLHKLTGYDMALYRGQTSIATTMKGGVTPAPGALQAIIAKGEDVFDQNNQDIALAYSPLRDLHNQIIATIVIWRPRAATQAAQSSISSTLALAFGFGAVLALIVAFLLGRSITRPLLIMADTADKIASGDLSQRVSAPSKDELGRLAYAFNQMTEKVGHRVEESEKESSRLQELDEFRLNLLTAITQALQAPVNNIKNHVSALSMSLYGALNEPQRRSVESIARSTAMEEALVADLVDFAQAQQKQLRVARERVPLREVLQDAMRSIEGRYKDKPIRFNSLIPNDLPPVFADRTRMEQVLSGLLDWAYNNSKPNGQVTFSAVALPRIVQIKVTDTSDGLSSEMLPKVFDLFYHPNGKPAERSTSDASGGLGLALVKALIEQQGGNITVEVDPGKGNVFTFTIPSTT